MKGQADKKGFKSVSLQRPILNSKFNLKASYEKISEKYHTSSCDMSLEEWPHQRSKVKLLLAVVG